MLLSSVFLPEITLFHASLFSLPPRNHSLSPNNHDSRPLLSLPLPSYPLFFPLQTFLPKNPYLSPPPLPELKSLATPNHHDDQQVPLLSPPPPTPSASGDAHAHQIGGANYLNFFFFFFTGGTRPWVAPLYLRHCKGVYPLCGTYTVVEIKKKKKMYLAVNSNKSSSCESNQR
jgi:hypothetical protein